MTPMFARLDGASRGSYFAKQVLGRVHNGSLKPGWPKNSAWYVAVIDIFQLFACLSKSQIRSGDFLCR